MSPQRRQTPSRAREGWLGHVRLQQGIRRVAATGAKSLGGSGPHRRTRGLSAGPSPLALARLPREDRGAVRQGAARLGDGPRHSDRGRAARDAPGRSADLVSARHDQGAAHGNGEGAARTTLAGRARRRRCQAAGARRGALRAGAQQRAHRQGARHAPAQAEMAVGAAQRAFRHEPDPRGIADEARRGARQGAGGLAHRRRQSRPADRQRWRRCA